MKDLVLITGASSGIGMEMSKTLASKQYDLVLTARRKDRLDQLKVALEAKYGIKVHVIVSDLGNSENAKSLFEAIKKKGLAVTMLINNAGFGAYGSFQEISLDKELEMIQLNISSLVVLTKLFATEMKERNYGRIMNVGSILSFFPFPYYSVYAATKAFVLSYSEALREELSGTNVSVTVLCPGPTDSEFASEKMLSTNAYQSFKPMDAEKVAKKGIEYMLGNRGTKVVGFMNKVTASTPRFSPRWMTLKINRHMASQKK